MISPARAAYLVFAPAVLLMAGCMGERAAPPADPAALAEYRGMFVLPDEPENVQTVSEVRTALSGKAPPNVLALLEEEGEEHDHAGHDPGDHDPGDHDHADHDHADDDHEEHADHEEEAQETEADLPERLEVTVVGVVGGVPNPMDQSVPQFPFAAGRAMFFIADPEAVAELEEHGHQHAPGEECSFCAAHAADAQELIAAVEFLEGKEETVVKVDARELFDLKEHDVVVVRGTARLDATGVLTVYADGIYVRR